MPEQMEIGLSDATTAPASVRNRLMWDLSQFSRLKVHFLNPEVLQDRSWYCGKYPLSPVTIISWACTWNTHATHYPKFVDGLFEKDEADIRVKFDSKYKVLIIMLQMYEPRKGDLLFRVCFYNLWF